MSAGSPRGYGVLVGRMLRAREDPGRSPHLSIDIEAGDIGAGGGYRAAVNIRSEDGSELLALLDPDWRPPAGFDLDAIASGEAGFTPVATGPGGQGLDYLRGGLVDPASLTPAPADGGPGSLAAGLSALVARAAADPDAVAVVFGDGFADPGADADFGFSPERGVHDIHMMQGNPPPRTGENRVRGDGALFVRFGDGGVTAFFARFATQSLRTDPATGDPLDGGAA